MKIVKAWSVAAVVALGQWGCNPPPPDSDLCTGRKAGDLVVTEYLSDPGGTDTGSEYIEVFNSLGTPVELKGVTVYVKKTDGTGLKSHVIRAGTIPARGYFTLGDVRSGALPAHIGYSYEGALGALPQSGGIIGLRCRDVVIDEIKYEKAAKAGHSRTFDGAVNPEATTNDDETKWCDAPELFAGTNYGSPGKSNVACEGTMTTTPGLCMGDDGTSRAVVSPTAGQLVISEVMANPKAVADSLGEWFEVHATADVDLNGLVLQSGTSKSTLSAPDCLHVGSGGYAVFAKNADAGVNGGVVGVTTTFGFALGNTGGTLSVGYADGGLIDAVTHPSALDGVAWQVDPTKLDAVKNDDPMAFCRATQMYGSGDLGTPGSANSACPGVVDMDTCIDSSTGSPRPIVHPVVGDLVITEFMANPGVVDDAVGEWVEVLATSAVDFNGLTLANEGTGMKTFTSQTCLSAAAGSYSLFARSSDSAVNGGLGQVVDTFGFGLANSTARRIVIKNGTTELDAITYETSTAGVSTQLSNNKLDAVSNDMASNFCLTQSAVYNMSADGGTGDRGTPGAANELCP